MEKPTTKTSPVTFIMEVREELKKVTWPKRSEVMRLTGIVIGVSIVVGIYVSGLDYLFTQLMGMIIK